MQDRARLKSRESDGSVRFLHSFATHCESLKLQEALEEKVVLLSPHGEGGPESSVQPTRPSDQQPPPAGQQQQQATTAAPTTTAQSTPETDADEEGDDDDDVEQMDYEGFIMAARKLLNEAG